MSTLILPLIAWVFFAALCLWRLGDRPLATWTGDDLFAAGIVVAATYWLVAFTGQHRREDAAWRATSARAHDAPSPDRK